MERLAEARLADPHQVVERIGRDAIRLGIGAGDDDASEFGLLLWLEPGRPALAPAIAKPVEAVRVIRRARGVPVLAHPGLANRDELIPELVEAGLLGIEAYYPEHSPGQTATYRQMCARLGLVATGGSDFHGPRIGGARHPGVQAVPESAWQELRDRLASLGSQPPTPPLASPPAA